MNASQHLRFTALASDHDAVSVAHLPEGVALVARAAGGAIAAVEVLDNDGRPMRTAEALRVVGAARQQAARTLEQTTDVAIALIALDEGELNLSATADELGMGRTTLYARLDAVEVARPAKSSKGAAR